MTDIEESESEFDLEHHGVKGMKWGQRKRYIREGLLFGEEYHDQRKGKGGRKGRGGGKGRGGSGKSAARKAERARKAAIRAAKAQERKTERARRKAERDAKRAVRDEMKRAKADRKMEIMRSKQEHQERMMRMKIEEQVRKQAQELQNSKQIQQKPQPSESTMSVSDHQRYLELSRKKVSQMSTNEINEWVNRTNAIQNYQRLTAEQAERNASAGKKIMNFVFDAGKEAAKEFAKQQIKSMVTKGLGNALSNAKSGNSAASNKAFQEVLKRAKHGRY